MITLLAKMIIKEGRETEFEERFAELTAKVLDREPDTLLYKLTRSQKVPNEYHVVEFYRNPEAVQTHGANMKDEPLMAGIAELVSAPFEFTLLDDVISA